MKRYGQELKQRRELADLTTRQLGDLLGKSGTYVTDLENAKKSNVPDPDAMLLIEQVLHWPVPDQLTAWGYISSMELAIPASGITNPFPRGDRRHQLFDKIDWENDYMLAIIDDLLNFTRRIRVTTDSGETEQETNEIAPA